MKYSAGVIDCCVQVANLDTGFRSPFLINVQQKKAYIPGFQQGLTFCMSKVDFASREKYISAEIPL
jgi:hypothetical protein